VGRTVEAEPDATGSQSAIRGRGTEEGQLQISESAVKCLQLVA
jgi:hypothetical protein